MKTIIVTGCARGGTTATARVVDHLFSVSTKEYSHAVTNPTKTRVMEHLSLGTSLLGGDFQKVKTLIEEFNKSSTWMFKYPGIFGNVINNLSYFRNPHVVYVTRDPSAVWHSTYRLDPQSATPESKALVSEEYARAFRLLPDRLPDSHTFVSFERLLTRPVKAVSELAQSLGVPFRESALNQIDLEDPRYNLNWKDRNKN